MFPWPEFDGDTPPTEIRRRRHVSRIATATAKSKSKELAYDDGFGRFQGDDPPRPPGDRVHGAVPGPVAHRQAPDRRRADPGLDPSGSDPGAQGRPGAFLGHPVPDPGPGPVADQDPDTVPVSFALSQEFPVPVPSPSPSAASPPAPPTAVEAPATAPTTGGNSAGASTVDSAATVLTGILFAYMLA
ncbi:hypothetical protein NL676_019844 [Syzygium grande]|nr:hypothetical protein NL676_019844 [Syzygium grande]